MYTYMYIKQTLLLSIEIQNLMLPMIWEPHNKWYTCIDQLSLVYSVKFKGKKANSKG